MGTLVSSLAKLVGGRLLGDDTIEIQEAATLAEARTGEISFLENPGYCHQLAGSSASAVVVPRGFEPEHIAAAIQVDDVSAAFVQIVKHFRPPRHYERSGVSSAAIVSPSARLADDVEIYPGATVGDEVDIGPHATIHAGVTIMADCKLGADVVIYPNVVLYENTLLGDRCIIHAGAILGAFGFGYQMVAGRHLLSAQLGHVCVGNDVEIGAGTTIDRGTYGPTVIGEGTKIDNLVMIAHNCRIGRHNIICSQVGIAGSASTGDYVVMAGQVGIRDHVHIGAQATLGAMAGITSDVPEGEVYIGIPATPHREQALQLAALSRLPEMRKQLIKMQQTLEGLSNEKDGEAPAAA
ncbi:MAG: UDP-3-O-(3-hydroxymyristoyl)glucosamine N-acyltransferase [Planctomycetales bacterium]